MPPPGQVGPGPPRLDPPPPWWASVCGGPGAHKRLAEEDDTINSFILQGLRPFLSGTLLLVPNEGDYEANLIAVWGRFSI